MNKNKQAKIFSLVFLSTISLLILSNDAANFIIALGQQQDATSNTSSTQVGGRMGEVGINSLTNLTRQDLDPILDNLSVAREELLRNNITSAFDSINVAEGELFRLTLKQGTNDSKEIDSKLDKLQRSIESAHDALLGTNSTRAILHLNAADTHFIDLIIELRP